MESSASGQPENAGQQPDFHKEKLRALKRERKAKEIEQKSLMSQCQSTLQDIASAESTCNTDEDRDNIEALKLFWQANQDSIDSISSIIAEYKRQIEILQSDEVRLGAAANATSPAAVCASSGLPPHDVMSSQRDGAIQVYVLLPPNESNGAAHSQRYSTTVNPTDTVLKLKTRLLAEVGIPIFQQRLFHWGSHMTDETTFAENNIQSNSLLHLVPPNLTKLPSATFVGKGFKPIDDDPKNKQRKVVKAVAQRVYRQSQTADALWKQKKKVFESSNSTADFDSVYDDIAASMQKMQEDECREYLKANASSLQDDEHLEKKKTEFFDLLTRSKGKPGQQRVMTKLDFSVDHPSKHGLLLWFCVRECGSLREKRREKHFVPLMFSDTITSQWNKNLETLPTKSCRVGRQQDDQKHPITCLPSVFPSPKGSAPASASGASSFHDFYLIIRKDGQSSLSVERGHDALLFEAPIALWSYRLLSNILGNDGQQPFIYFSEPTRIIFEDNYEIYVASFTVEIDGQDWIADLNRMSATTEPNNFPQMELRREEIAWIRAGHGEWKNEWISMSYKETEFIEAWHRDPATATTEFKYCESYLNGIDGEKGTLKIVPDIGAVGHSCALLKIDRLPLQSHSFFVHRKVCTSFQGDILYQCAMWPRFLLEELNCNKKNCCTPPLDIKDLVLNTWNAVTFAQSLVLDERSARCLGCNPQLSQSQMRQSCPVQNSQEGGILMRSDPCYIWGCSYCLHRDNYSKIHTCIFAQIRPAVEMIVRKGCEEVCGLLKEELKYDLDANARQFESCNCDGYRLCEFHFPKPVGEIPVVEEQDDDENDEDCTDESRECSSISDSTASAGRSCSFEHICDWVGRLSRLHKRPCWKIPWYASKVKRWPHSDGPDQIGKLFCNCYDPSQGFCDLFLRNIDSANLCNALSNCRHFEKWFQAVGRVQNATTVQAERLNRTVEEFPGSWAQVMGRVQNVRKIRNESLSHAVEESFDCLSFSTHAKSIFALFKSFGAVVFSRYPKSYSELKVTRQNAIKEHITDVKLEDIRRRFHEVHSPRLQDVHDEREWKESPREHCVIALKFCCESLMNIRMEEAREIAEAGRDDVQWRSARDKSHKRREPFERLIPLVDEYVRAYNENSFLEEWEIQHVPFSCQTYLLVSTQGRSPQVCWFSSLSLSAGTRADES